LAIAQSVVAAFEVVILVSVMAWRDPRLFNSDFWRGVVRILSVTGYTALTTYIMVKIVPFSAADKGFSTLGAKFLSIVVPSIAVHISVSAIFGIEEARPVIEKMRKVVLKPVRIE
jgi:hypothetical protein